MVTGWFEFWDVEPDEEQAALAASVPAARTASTARLNLS
jgi:hypothetical protein